MLKKLRKYTLCAMVFAALFACTACESKQDNNGAEVDQANTVEEITIPASIFKFANSDIEDNLEEFKEYCTDVKQDGNNLILTVTPSQKEDLIEMYTDSIDDVLEDMTEANPDYYVETDKDHSRFVYHFDKEIDGILQAKMLLMITSSDVLTGIFETGNSDWNVQAKIVNCHTGLTIGETTFPDGSMTFGAEEWNASYDNGAQLQAKRAEIMSMTGLSGTYDELSDSQESAVNAIVQMMDWMEGKYGESFRYISYAPGDATESEHLKVYPEQGHESDVVTVYRSYENGRYRYEDDYDAILMRPAYEEQVQAFAQQYLPVEGIKIYTEVKDTDNHVSEEDSILNTVSAGTYIFMNEDLCSEQYEAFRKAVPDWLTEHCQGVPAGIYLRMTTSDEWQQINRSNYEEKLREKIYTEKAEYAVSESGKVTAD